MTTINSQEDFLRALSENPQWKDAVRAQLLGEEMLQLPARLAEFVQSTNRNFELVYQRLDRLETDVAEIKTDVAVLKTDVAVLKTDVAELKTDVAELKTDVAVLKTDVAELKTDVAELKTDVAVLKTDVAELKIDGKQANSKLDNIVGSEIERQVHGNIINIASRPLGLTRVRVRRSNLIPMDVDLQNAIQQTEDEGTITAQQADHITESDIILTGFSRAQQSDVHAAVEVSRTIRNGDITRARDRANHLGMVMNASAVAAVVGGIIEPPQKQLADEMNVATILRQELAI